jgi:RNA polymerase sigma factor (sigma-70 family)
LCDWTENGIPALTIAPLPAECGEPNPHARRQPTARGAAHTPGATRAGGEADAEALGPPERSWYKRAMPKPAATDDWLPTRTSLIKRLKDWEDDESWKDFFDTYSRLLYSVASKAGFGDAEAQDIVQETVIAVAKQMPDFQYDPGRGSFKAWLLSILRRRIIDRLRRRQRRPQFAEERPSESSRTALIQRIPDPAPAQLEQIWNDEWQTHLFALALQRVREQSTARDFQIFDCLILKQWPVKKVASALRVNEPHVYVAKSRVAGLLRKEVERLEVRWSEPADPLAGPRA